MNVTIETALAFHQAGEFGRAEDCYRRVIETHPRNADALHLLGILKYQQSEWGEAVGLMRRALDAGATSAIWSNLGLALKAGGNIHEAISAFRQALALCPDDTAALNNLGNALRTTGDCPGAVAICRRAIKLKPDFVEAYHNLALALMEQGDLGAAEADCLVALDIQPGQADVLFTLGMIRQRGGQLAAAADCYRESVLRNTGNVAAQFALGSVLQQSGQMDEAIEIYETLLSRIPTHVDAGYNRALAYHALGRLDVAIAGYTGVLAMAPEHLAALNNLGNARQERRENDEAAACYRRVLAVAPNDARAHCNLGVALKNLGDITGSLDSYDKALLLKPDYAQAYCNRGVALREMGRSDEAITSFENALARQADYPDAYSNQLFTLAHYDLCTPDEYLAKAREYGERIGKRARPYTSWPGVGVAEGRRRLKIGFVSGDLKNHPVGFFLEGILAHLDQSQFDLVAYVTKQFSDSMTERLMPRFSGWHSLTGMDDAAAAHLIHTHDIDILIDLAGHTAHNRLPLFAWQPAPVQVSWLGYFASTGVPGMDYLLADERSVPVAQRQYFTERVWPLPDTRLCFTAPPAAERLPVAELPAMQRGYITFGSYQNLAKVSDAVLLLWGNVLQALPQARLRLQNKQLKDPAIRAALLQRLAQAGIAAERVGMENPVRREPYLQSHGEVDIILDTFPFPGGTTTCEALWMGVPTLTLAGRTLLSRQGASLLACAGLEDWIAKDAQDYVGKAVSFASDPAGLARLRRQLRAQILASPLCDAEKFARNLELALWGMWQDKMRKSRL